MSTRLGLTAVKRRFKGYLCRNEALILTYHSVLPQGTNLFPNAYHMESDVFTQQMEYLIGTGFNCVSLEQLAGYISKGFIPPRTVAITFDDGFYNNYSVVFPVLKKLGIPATIFIATGFIGKEELAWPEKLAMVLAIQDSTLEWNGQALELATRDDKARSYAAIAKHFSGVPPAEIKGIVSGFYAQAGLDEAQINQHPLYQALRFMEWSDVRALAESGLIAIGSHTATHRRLVYLDESEAINEIRDSRQTIIERVGKCEAFAYPHGRRNKDFSERDTILAREAGYSVIVTADAGSVVSDSNPLNLNRFNVLADCDLDYFDYFMQGGLVLSKPVSRMDMLKGLITGVVTASR